MANIQDENTVRSPGIPDEAWTRHWDTIIRLYIELDMPLHQVRTEMQVYHEFNATEAQYKYKFKQRNVKKTLKEWKLQRAYVVYLWRQAKGKRTKVTHRGVEIDIEEEIRKLPQRVVQTLASRTTTINGQGQQTVYRGDLGSISVKSISSDKTDHKPAQLPTDQLVHHVTFSNSDSQQGKPADEVSELKPGNNNWPSAVAPLYARMLDSALFGNQSSILANLGAKSDHLSEAYLLSHMRDFDHPLQVPSLDSFHDDVDATMSEASHPLDHHPSAAWLDAILRQYEQDCKVPTQFDLRIGDEENMDELVIELDDDAA